MNYGATVRIRIERLDGHGTVLESDTVSLYRQPFTSSSRWFVRRGGRRSKAVSDLTITQFNKMLGSLVKSWLKKTTEQQFKE